MMLLFYESIHNQFILANQHTINDVNHQLLGLKKLLFPVMTGLPCKGIFLLLCKSIPNQFDFVEFRITFAESMFQ